jgi:hypothetical protein
MLTILLVAARLVLAATLALAGTAKLLDRAGTRDAVVAFGVPLRLAGTAAWLLPAVELGIALSLLASPTAWAGSLAAMALLGAFTVAVAVKLARDERVDCNCFGALSRGHIGKGTVARNVLLLSLAVAVAVLGRGDPGPGVGEMARVVSAGAGATGLLAALNLTAVAALAWVALGLWRQQGRILSALDELRAAAPGQPVPGLPDLNGGTVGPEPGSPAPAFALPDLEGRSMTLKALLARGKPVVLLFAEPGCGPCAAVLTLLRGLGSRLSAITLTVVSHDARGLSGAVGDRQGVREGAILLEDRERALPRDYHLGVVPCAVWIGEDGRVGLGRRRGPTRWPE